jgi:hypothetical protein
MKVLMNNLGGLNVIYQANMQPTKRALVIY